VQTPEEWLANFEEKVANVQQKAAAFRENLDASGATEASDDGSLRVTVAPNGALTDLTIDDTAMRRSGGELATQIIKLARKAQRAAAVNVAEAFAPLAGADSESLRMVTGYIPPPEDEEPEPDGGHQRYVFTDEPAEAEQPGRSQGRPAHPHPGKRDDDEDFADEQIFGRRHE
jgi:DNA-binding protein YbaB